METTRNENPEGVDSEMMDVLDFEIQEVRYSLPQMMRELQLERTQSYFAKEIIDQVEISKLFNDARIARGKRKQS